MWKTCCASYTYCKNSVVLTGTTLFGGGAHMRRAQAMSFFWSVWAWRGREVGN